jgi:hypothetical protein
MKTYHGSCHCGAVTFEVDADFTEGMTCNCSHCKRKGILLAFVPKSQFRLLTGEDKLTLYHFNKNVIDHLFCQTCGVESYGQSGETIAINLNCIADEDLDHASLTISKIDGRSF